MVDNVVPTLVPQQPAADSPFAPPKISPLDTSREALFNSIAEEKAVVGPDAAPSAVRTAFAVLLWFGYSIAIVVALVLIGSAARQLLGGMPH